VNAGQLAAIDQDEAVDHLSGDTIIRSKAEVTAESDRRRSGVGR
jgi:hypothetical protein